MYILLLKEGTPFIVSDNLELRRCVDLGFFAQVRSDVTISGDHSALRRRLAENVMTTIPAVCKH